MGWVAAWGWNRRVGWVRELVGREDKTEHGHGLGGYGVWEISSWKSVRHYNCNPRGMVPRGERKKSHKLKTEGSRYNKNFFKQVAQPLHSSLVNG